jgi:hypothetical protein
MLNCSITDTEIENVVRNLPNNKAVGTDCMRNEYLKSTLHLLLPSYVKIFNIIFDTGIFPESWTLGISLFCSYSSSEELIFLKYSYISVNGTSTLDILAFVHRFSISQNVLGL